MTNPQGNRIGQTIALDPEQKRELEQFCLDLGNIMERHYSVSEFIRARIDESLSQTGRDRIVSKAQKEKRLRTAKQRVANLYAAILKGERE